MQCALLHQDGGHRAHALVQPGLNHHALCAAVGVRLQLFHLGHKVDVLQQVFNALARQRRHGHADGVAAPFLRHQLILGQLFHHMRGVGRGFIHFIDGHDDGDARSFCMVDGFHRLRHDAIVRRHHQHGNIRHFGAARTHGRKGLVARRIQEGDNLSVLFHLVSADVLGDAARLARGDARFANGVQNGGFAMVHMAHYHHNGRALHKVFGLVVIHFKQALFNGDVHLVLHLGAQLFRH